MAKTKVEPRRALELHYKPTVGNTRVVDVLEIGKAVEVTITDPEKRFLCIERMKNGKYRLTWTKGFFSGIAGGIRGLDHIKMVRE